MKRYFGWLTKRWSLSLLGVLLLSLLVWYLGPLLVFDRNDMLAREVWRWRVILLLFVIWAAYFIYVFFQARQANRSLISSVSGRQPFGRLSGGRESQAEIMALSEGMREAMAILRRANPGWNMSGQYLYKLPWYMIVGTPDSGRTTMLSQSGLNFPLRDSLGKSSLRGVGATLHCDWWFADEAVLLDTAGHDPTDDSFTQADKTAWNGFLGLLKKHRPLRPINGVIVTISVGDLLQQSEAERQANAQAIRARINELHERLGLRFPVYVVITKCDLLPGFVEFFEPFGLEERSQVWGITFELPQTEADGQSCTVLTAFPIEFKALERQLLARTLERVQQEPDLVRRALLYGFAQKFASIKDVLAYFLNSVFESNSYQEPTLLRGVYFISGNQVRTSFDQKAALISELNNGSSSNSEPVSGRSYFITRLMREVIFKESGLAGSTFKEQRRQRTVKRFGVVTIGLFLLALAATLTVSYDRNKHLVSVAETDAAKLAKLAEQFSNADTKPVTLAQTLPVLNAARNLSAGFSDGALEVSPINGMGLYQGYKLGDGAVLLYQRLLRNTLLPAIVADIESSLQRGEASNEEFLYETLRVYLMLGYRQYFDASAVQAWVEFGWRNGALSINDTQRQQLLAHLSAMLAAYPKQIEPVRLDAALVSQVRSILIRTPLAHRVYSRLKKRYLKLKTAELTVNNISGRDVSSLLMRKSGESLSRGVNGLYRVAGYRELLARSEQVIASMSQDSWVLNDQDSAGMHENFQSLKTAVLELYFTDYIREWDSILADIRPVPLTNLGQAAEVIKTLSAPDSPVRLLLLAAERETRLERLTEGVDNNPVDHAQLDKFDEAQRKLSSVLDFASTPLVATPVLANSVDRHFADLHKLVGGAGGQSLEEAFALLREAGQYFDDAEEARRSGTPPPKNDILIRLGKAAPTQIAPLSSVFRDIAERGGALTMGSARERLNDLWRASGASFCRDAIADRYPLVRSASRDITADDFGKFFGPGGIVDDFFNRNLAAYVDMSRGQWRWRTVGPTPLHISQEVLNQFQYAARLRDMFFVPGARQPSLRFDLKALTADAALSSVSLDIDGQPVLYESGTPGTFSPILLPSGKGRNQVRLSASSASGGEVYSEGPWAWLRMMDKGKLNIQQGERYQLTFSLGGSNVVYELRPSSVINPFRQSALGRFRCPSFL